jgi:cytochrome c556
VSQFLNQEDGDIHMKRIVMTGAILLSSLVSFTAAAAEQSPEQQAANAVATRQAVFKLLAFSNGVIGGMARGAPYDAEAAILATERIEMLAGMIPALFAADTTAVAHGATTRAADTIWGSKADFDQLAADLATGAVAARAALEAQGAAALPEVTRTHIGAKCGACHDRFRLE